MAEFVVGAVVPDGLRLRLRPNGATFAKTASAGGGMTMPSVSVIIPTLGRPAMLTRALRSVSWRRAYADFEVVVVVDGPDDVTVPKTIEAMDARIRVVSLAVNVGLAEARNVGIQAAVGRYIALLDDDDEWLPEKLREQHAKALELGGGYVFVPCKVHRADGGCRAE